ncbi:unnamed protein product [Orchesella dallaii]|uniref:Uncharacterized protein n=1 Tax=Orchesella dallaii TaxID=48710 RepID=A0ABP1RUS4_9HEXA
MTELLFIINRSKSTSNPIKINPSIHDCTTMEKLYSEKPVKTSHSPGLKSTVKVTSTMWPLAPPIKPVVPALTSHTCPHLVSSKQKDEEIQLLRLELSKLREDLRDYKLRAEKKTQHLIDNNIKLSFKVQKHELKAQTQNTLPLQCQNLNAEIQWLKEINRELELEMWNQYSILSAGKAKELAAQRQTFDWEINLQKLESERLSKKNEALTTEFNKNCADFIKVELKHGELERLFNDLNFRFDQLQLKNEQLEKTLLLKQNEDVGMHQKGLAQLKDFTMKTNELEKTVGKLGVEIALEKQKTKSLEQQNLLLIQEKARLEAILEGATKSLKRSKTC